MGAYLYERNNMIRVLLKKMVDDKSFEWKERLTLNDVAERTGISRATLNRVANTPGYNTNTDTLNALCKFFKCELSELAEYVPDDNNKDDDK